MKQKDLKEECLNSNFEANKIVSKKIIIKSSISFVIFACLLVFSFINKSKVSKLSIINIDLFIYIGFIFGLISLIFIVFGILLHNNNSIINTLTSYKIYSFYDVLNFLIDIVYIIFFVISFIMTPTTVSGNSMCDTLYDTDKMLVWHLGYTPKENDIVIIDVNSQNYNVIVDEQFYIKRVVGVEDSVVTYKSVTDSYGNVYINDEYVEKVYYINFVKMCSSYNKEKDSYDSYVDETGNSCVIPKGYSIVLGDNRNNSNDSRFIGLIKNSDILGHAFFRYYSKYSKIGVPETNIRH